MIWAANKVTFLRVFVGFVSVSLFGHNPLLNLLAVALTVTAIAFDALDGHIARTKQMATPVGAQVDILGDRVVENMYFTYFAVVGMVSFWLPMLFFARGATADLLRSLALKAGYFGWGANGILQSKWAHALVASRWSRGAYATMKCLCFCYLGLELALTRGPVALLRGLLRHSRVPGSGRRLEVLGRKTPEPGHETASRKARGMNIESLPQARIAAFFDLDGTLLPEPALERRLFNELRHNHKIPLANYLRWAAESLRLLPHGLLAIQHRNKRYLTDIPCDLVFRYMDSVSFFEEGITRIAWHVRQAHKIILVSATLDSLANLAATALACELETLGLELQPLLCVTRLKEHRGQWTGDLAGSALYGPAKARAVEALAKRENLDLRQSHAYANSLLDRYFLFTVGHAHAVNPGKELAAIANERNWPIWHWCQPQTANFQRNNCLSSRIESLEKQA